MDEIDEVSDARDSAISSNSPEAAPNVYIQVCERNTF